MYMYTTLVKKDFLSLNNGNFLSISFPLHVHLAINQITKRTMKPSENSKEVSKTEVGY